jgi:sec-independent protein translocase protein TatA
MLGGHFGPLQILLIAVVVLVLFGRGKVSSLMGEVGKGITAFKKGVNEGTREIEDAAARDAAVTAPPVAPAPMTPTVVTPVPPPPAEKDKV